MIEQADRRRVNSDRVRLFGAADRERVIALICECGDAGCHETVLMQANEYEQRVESGEVLLHRKHLDGR